MKRSISGQKILEAPDKFKRRCAHLLQKRFLPDNTCFVDADLFQNCSLNMQKKDGHDQVKRNVRSYLQ